MKNVRKSGRTDLEDPFVHDNNSNIETPPLKNSEQRSKHAPLKNHTLLHFPICFFSRKCYQRRNPQNSPQLKNSTSPPFQIAEFKIKRNERERKRNQSDVVFRETREVERENN